MTSPDCTHPNRRLLITMSRTTWAEATDDGVYVLLPEDFDDPDTTQVELICRDCNTARLLTDNEWDVA